MKPMTVMNARAALESVETDSILPIDVRWSLAAGADRAAYLDGHLPGAVFVDFDAEICGPPGTDGRHPLPDPQSLQEALRCAGVDDDSTLLVYDGGDMLAAARTWWTLRWAGVTGVHVLDGGIESWREAGGDVETGPVPPSRGTVTVRPGGMPVLDAAGAAEVAVRGVLIDVRAPARYRGEFEPVDPVAGHIPEAANRPGDAVMSAGGGMVDSAGLQSLYGDLADSEVGVYCGSGVAAARTAMAFDVAGLPVPHLYVGSWSEWTADGDRAVAKGP